MAQESLRQFARMVLQDGGLQRRLGGIRDPQTFAHAAAHLGGEMNLPFAPAEVAAALSEWKHRPIEDAVVTNELLKRWTPVSTTRDSTTPAADWTYLGETRFIKPFFDDTARICTAKPLSKLCRFLTPLDALAELQSAHPGLPPTGFIYHMSRCGSTLISRMLAALPQNVVVSEAPLIDSVLSAHFGHPEITEERRIAWLRGVISAIGRARHGERHVFVKLDCWHAMALPLIRRAFPDVPWIFLARDPVEVMVSHSWERGQQMVPGIIDPGWFGIKQEVGQDFLDEYCAKVLGEICRAAALHHGLGGGRIVNYRQLPDAVWSWLPDFFGIRLSGKDEVRMRYAARFHAKRPIHPFSGDSAKKTAAATDSICRFAEQWAEPHYQQLEALTYQHEQKE